MCEASQGYSLFGCSMVVIKQLSSSHIPGLRRNQEKGEALRLKLLLFTFLVSLVERTPFFGHNALVSQSQDVIDVIISKVPAPPAVVCALNFSHFWSLKLHKANLFVVVSQWSRGWI